jgi:HEPN domain-containing protein
LRFNPTNESEYRRRLAEEYFQDAEARLQEGDFRGCVQFSQLAAENAAKVIVATKRSPSWAHDPSPELLAILSQFRAEYAEQITRLSEICATLAPEHGRTTYGEPERFATPKSLYDSQSAERALNLATEACQIMKNILPEDEGKHIDGTETS